MIRNIIIFFTILMSMACLSSCEDRFDYGVDPIPAGEGSVEFTIGYKSFSPALSRSQGDALKSIKTLWLVVYNSEGALVMSKSITDLQTDVRPNTRPDGAPSSETTTGHATFKLSLPNGRYRIYAVANMDLAGRDVSTEDNLRGIKAEWSSDAASKNAEMFGWFVNGDNTTERDEGFSATDVVIKGDTRLHAWLRRAASKVTVAIDGSALYDGVEVFIKSIQVRDIPTSCFIGRDNTAGKGEIIEEGEKFIINETMDSEGPSVSNASPLLYVASETGAGKVETASETLDDTHTDSTPALYFYENKQGRGKDKTQVDKDDDGKPDDADLIKDDKPYGTYVEVVAYYVSTNEKRPGCGTIRYRFMLGKDIYNDYDAERNYHYKLTLLLKYFANDPDWHIEYDQQILEVSMPEIFNYQGKVFAPDSTLANFGHNFVDKNPIKVLSYTKGKKDGEDVMVDEPWTATFDYVDENGRNVVNSPNPPSWLLDFPANGGGSQVLDVRASVGDVETVNINSCLNAAPTKGSESAYYNLAGLDNSGNIVHTANCYIVDSKGYYMFPLVYGNAVESERSYKQPDAEGDDPLLNFKDYLNNDIESPYIRDKYTPADAYLVWQDEEELVTGIYYDPDEYNKKGAIKFKVLGTVKQGNAVIAIRDSEKRVMWSWHIWVTNLESMEETIEVTNRDQDDTYDLMSVNLGWCSNNNPEVKYYKRRECKVTFTARKLSRQITVVQESHMAFPRGDNPYYQWGRKDPFIATNIKWGNKRRYCGGDGSNAKLDSIKYEWASQNPTRFYDDYTPASEGGGMNPGFFHGEERQPTKNVFHLMIQHPDLFHNPPLEEGGSSYISINDVSTNQWGDENVDNRAIKTVYDPCPIGYQVGGKDVFSAFSTVPNTDDVNTWMDVRKENIYKENPHYNLYEFYTNRKKYKSIIFPQTGYRDWNDRAGVLRFGETDDDEGNGNASVGYSWSNEIQTDRATGEFKSDAGYNFEFSRKHTLHGPNGYVRTRNPFYACDAFPIRPVKQK